MISDATVHKKNRSSQKFSTEIQSNNFWKGLLWYALGLFFILGTASYLAFNQPVVPVKFMPVTVLVSALYISICINRYLSDNYQSYRAIGLSAFYATVGIFLIFSIAAFFRFNYSRSFLSLTHIIMVSWLAIGMLFFRNRHQSYIVIKGGIADKLQRFSDVGWRFLEDYRAEGNFSYYDGIVVDLHAHNDEQMLKTLADSNLQGVPVLHAASVYEKYSGRSNLDYLAEEGFYQLTESHVYRIFKRIWEVLLIMAFFPVIISLMAVVALVIKFDSKGPVLFTQQRIGKNDTPFILYKFRSMTDKAEEDGAQFATKDDKRITKVGQFIRKFRIDELPQFWNVIKGDMSLIGPRPEQQEFVSFFKEEISFYSYRHKVRPGITGWAQVKSGYASDLDSTVKKLEHDLYYVKNINLSLDLLIVYATLKTILTGFGSR
jgi:lipopolysaccharide/colanic/teichoic acid biosynthesis glycosyltransferase